MTGVEPYGELVAEALGEARLTRDCTVCDGDGIKDNGNQCGGCGGTGKVPMHWGVHRLLERLATAIETLERRVATEHALFVVEARKHSEWLERAIDAERVQRLMADDWVQFCESMDVRFDTQEAVAYALQARINAVERERDELLADLRTARRALRGEP